MEKFKKVAEVVGFLLLVYLAAFLLAIQGGGYEEENEQVGVYQSAWRQGSFNV